MISSKLPWKLQLSFNFVTLLTILRPGYILDSGGLNATWTFHHSPSPSLSPSPSPSPSLSLSLSHIYKISTFRVLYLQNKTRHPHTHCLFKLNLNAWNKV
jgi:hypothetical protein